MWMFCLHISVCLMFVSDPGGGPEEHVGFLELELLMVVFCHAYAGDQTPVLSEGSKRSLEAIKKSFVFVFLSKINLGL